MGLLRHGTVRALLGFLLLLQPILALPTTASITAEETACNGRKEYCDRSYSDITFLGAHDSPFVGPLPQHNQNIDVEAQLDMGIRYLQGQTHRNLLSKNSVELCHTSCFLADAGKLRKYLARIKKWLDAHPREVVTLLLTNGHGFDVETFGKAFVKSGIVDYAFVPQSDPLPMKGWPTLGEMIASGKRLVVFLDYGADTSSVNYILDEFQYYFETAFGVTDPSFSDCSIDRPDEVSATGRMYIVNHFLARKVLGIKVPYRSAAPRTNAATGDGSIGSQVKTCVASYDRKPNVVLADFVDKGEVMEAQDMLNVF